MKHSLSRWLKVFVCAVVCTGTSNVALAEVGEVPSVNSKIQKLKKRAEQLHKDLATLEADLLYPASSQMAVYVSITHPSFDLDSLKMTINGEEATSYLYSDEQVSAFSQGGVQQLYLDNVAPGYFEIEISINGTNDESSPTNFLISERFHKDDTALALELIIDSSVGANGAVTTKLVQR
jgi:hypothetical protein